MGMLKAADSLVHNNGKKEKSIAKSSAKEERTRLTDKIRFVLKNRVVIFALIYMISPIDLLPDAMPIIGQIDDLIPIIAALCNTMDRAAAKVGRDA